MLIGLCGPPCAGKTLVARFLSSELGFTCVRSSSSLYGRDAPALVPLCWRRDVNVVVDGIGPGDDHVQDLLKRPYFMLIYVNAPTVVRFLRASSVYSETLELADFVSQDDALMHGNPSAGQSWASKEQPNVAPRRYATLLELWKSSHVHVFNGSDDVESLYAALRKINITNSHHLRPGWDQYFMSLAILASERTNCMKRRVGCVIARNRRLVATGYNGTPSKVLNCQEGGCPRCNGGTSHMGVGLDLCLCLHAEENAIIEAGRERCEGATLYTNLFPCTLCAKKIIQAGIVRVVYMMQYATDDVAKKLLQAGQVIVECHSAS